MTNVTFNIHIKNFPFLSSNIPTSPAYGVFISKLIRYARACSSYGCFILRATRLSNKLHEQGYVKERLKSSLRKFYGRYGDLIKQYEVSLSQMLNDILWTDHIQWQPPTDQTLYRTRPFTEFWVVSIEHLRRVWHASGHLVPYLWDLHMFYLLRPILFRTCHYFSGLCSSNIPRYFLDFTYKACDIIPPPPYLRQCITLFAVDQGWLLLDIGSLVTVTVTTI